MPGSTGADAPLRATSFRRATRDADSPGSAQGRDSIGISVLSFDRAVLKAGHIPGLLEHADIRGFHPLVARLLTTKETEAVCRHLVKEEPIQEFDPALVAVVLDLAPATPTRRQLRTLPGIDNRRLETLEELSTGEACWDTTRETGRILFRCTRNNVQAWSYIRRLLPDDEGGIRQRIREWQEAFTTPFPVIARLSGRDERAKVEIVEFDGGRAVCKTFRPGKEHILRRELEAISGLRETVTAVPDVLAFGDNWMVTPLYEHVPGTALGGLLVPLDRAKQIIAAVDRIHKGGYVHLDLAPGNMIFDKRTGLKIIDWEWATPIGIAPQYYGPELDLSGVPDSVQQQWFPVGPILRRDFGYPWKNEIGLSLASLRNDPEWKQHCSRVAYACGHLAPKLVYRTVVRAASAVLQKLGLT